MQAITNLVALDGHRMGNWARKMKKKKRSEIYVITSEIECLLVFCHSISPISRHMINA